MSDKEEIEEIEIDFENLIEGEDGSIYMYDPETDKMFKLLFPKYDASKDKK